MVGLGGQWVAKYSGSNTGTLVLGIDDRGDHYEGTGCVWDDNLNYPNSFVRFETPSRDNTQRFVGLQVMALDNNGNFLTPETLLKLRDEHGINFPATADVQLTLQNEGLDVSWKTSIGTFGSVTATAPKTRAGLKSELVPLPINTWDEFKSHVNEAETQRYVYRGQQTTHGV